MIHTREIPMTTGELSAIRRLQPVIALAVREDIFSGSFQIKPPSTTSSDIPDFFAITDGRRFRSYDGDRDTHTKQYGSLLGFQQNYASVLPRDTPIEVFWAGSDVNVDDAMGVTANRLRKAAARGNTVVLLTGGEHISEELTGSESDVNQDEVKIYGYDIQRDIVGYEILRLVEDEGLPIIAICRGSQMALNYFTGRDVKPVDHKQEEFHSIIELPDGGEIYNKHAVRNVFPNELKDMLRERFEIEIPEVNIVNSAHAQGVKVKEIDEGKMNKLRKNGWHPWLVANIPDIDENEQTYEAWLRIDEDTGKITGIMTQFHPERPDAPFGDEVISFINDILNLNKSSQENVDVSALPIEKNISSINS
jgi:anthranilate/para-aminobenzoate synthase component II